MIINAKDEKKKFLKRLKEHRKKHNSALYRIAEGEDPWVFVCIACQIEYLKNMISQNGKTLEMSDFIEKYFFMVNPRYSQFSYTNKELKLSWQFYYVLRNGLVHNFTMTPNRKEGRINSIILTHKGPHLYHYTQNSRDACILNAYDLISEIDEIIDVIFEGPLQDPSGDEAKQIFDYYEKYGPIGPIS